MNIVVAGGAGFVGSHLCERLLSLGHSVVCVDSFATSSPANVRHFLGDSRLVLQRTDISEPFEISGPVDYVLHFASPASPVDYLSLPIETLKVGALGTFHLLDLARSKGAKFLLASTSEVYGDPQVHPQPEGYWGNVNPIGPRSVYDESKRFAEAVTMAYHRTHRLDTKIIRIFNTYGPRMRSNDGRVVPTFISQALKDEPLTVFGSGDQTRSYCYVSDLVEGVIRVMLSPLHEPVNLGNPSEMTVAQLARLIIELSGSKSTLVHKPLPQDDPTRRKPDISRAERELGWKPMVGLEEGLKKTIDWFRQPQ